MRKFNLQKPHTREWANEWLMQQVAKDFGFISLRYDFYELFINGESRGVYAFEEYFDKRLLSHNGRREGPIVQFHSCKDADFIFSNVLIRYDKINAIISASSTIPIPTP